jgi:hypothetical protein
VYFWSEASHTFALLGQVGWHKQRPKCSASVSSICYRTVWESGKEGIIKKKRLLNVWNTEQKNLYMDTLGNTRKLLFLNRWLNKENSKEITKFNI